MVLATEALAITIHEKGAAVYTLYGSPRSRAFRVIWMLEELEQTYDVVACAPHSKEIKTLNASGKIPALTFDDQTLVDSVAICQFLADRHNALTFTAGAAERAHQDSFTQLCVDELEGALWTAAKHTFVLPEDLRIPAIKAACQFEFAAALKTLENRLGDKTHVMGDQFTVPDLLIGQCAAWAAQAKFKLPETGPLADYFTRTRERPAFKRALLRANAAEKLAAMI